MRLTLRTLLSYLDDVLDPESRDELRRQIESNENATEWIHRTRDVTRRLKLGAPEIDGASSVDDPNTVAEYLDRTLPEESVQEFERVCLESDAMLAEVASCHHVLAMMLAEPPEVDPDTQRRLHRLQADLARALETTAEPTPAAAPTPETAPPAPAAGPSAPTTAPDYLRDPGGGLGQWGWAIAALLLLTVTAVLAFRPGGWLNPAPQVALVEEEGAATPTPLEEGGGALPTDEAEDLPPPDDAGATPVEPAEADPSEGEPADPPAPVEPAAPPAEAPPAEEPVETPTPEPAAPVTGEAVEEPAGETPPGETADPMTETGDGAVTPAAETEPVELPTLTLVSEHESLVVTQAETGAWRRLLPGDTSPAPMRLVSLPTYRDTVAVVPTVTVELVGQTEAALTPPGEASGRPGVELAFGRLIVRVDPAAEAAQTVDVLVDGVAYVAELGPGAVLALAADRPYLAGFPVLQQSPPLVAIAHGLAGEIAWSSRGVDLKISKPQRWYVTGDDVVGDTADLGDPGWVEELKVSSTDQFAARELVRQVAPDAPVWPQLLEIATQDELWEVRLLASRCAMALGHADPLVASFDRAEEKTGGWRESLVTLRAAASRSPVGAAAVMRGFVEAYGERTTEELFDLLVGFSPEEVGLTSEAVSAGVISESVVPALGSEDLATRVMASLVLEEAIEPMERPYRPLDGTRRRIQAIRRIESRLEDGDLEPRVR